MSQNQQADAAGSNADEIIKNLATPAEAIETDKTTVEVIDKAQPVNPQEHDWKQRYSSYRANTDKTIHSLREKAKQFDMMSDRVASLESERAQLQEQIPKTPDEMLELFSKEEIEAFTGMVGNEVGSLRGQVDQLNQELERVKQVEAQNVAMDHHQQVVNVVKQSVPNYQTIDQDPAFKEWMNQSDDYGNVRIDLLRRAKSSLPPDISRIIQFYFDFDRQKQVVEQQPTQPQTYTQQELLQQPESRQTGGTVAPQSSGIQWNTATASQFYKEKALGKIDPKQAELLEKELIASLYPR